MTHHIYWKTPFEKVLDYARVRDNTNYPTINDLPFERQNLKIIDKKYRDLHDIFDLFQNRFDIGDKSEHKSCGDQGT